MNYLKKRVLVDIFSNVSLLLIDEFEFLSVIFFLKLEVFSDLLKKIEESFHLTWKMKNIINLFKLMILILCISHIFACIWLLEAKYNPMDPETEYENWMVFRDVSEKDWIANYNFLKNQLFFINCTYFLCISWS